MRIHSDSIDELEVRKAARLAGVGFTRLSLHGSRSRAAAFDVKLTGSAGRRQNFGGDDEAASWDEHGIFLGHLHRLDPNLKTPYYEGGEHYVWATGGRFTVDFTPAMQHRRHRWEFSGDSVTGSYSVFECGGRNACGAIMRSLRGATWADLNQ
jgi:hypothetical protein